MLALPTRYKSLAIYPTESNLHGVYNFGEKIVDKSDPYKPV